jgi:DNA-binding ferritin-like protein (Dps family)
MRANIPKEPRPPVVELEGIYLQAMKEASVRLMDVFPAGNDLWEMLGQIEAMLLEAQLREMPLTELFGEGGVAAFCQSIVDEYKADGETGIPASDGKLVKAYKRIDGPRGGVNYRKHRVKSGILAAVLILAFALLALWYTGILRYWTAGDSYYLEELHNFQSTVTDTLSAPIEISMPLKKTVGLSDTLYADAAGYDIRLSSLDTHEHAGSYPDPDTGETVYVMMTNWILRMSYRVESDFNRVTYVEPPSDGTVTVTLADGTVYSGKIVWMESGGAGEGREFARISVIELPSDTNIEGATLTIVMDPPKRVEWNRVSTGHR